MRGATAVLVAGLLLLPLLPPAQAGRANELWDVDRTFTSDYSTPEGMDIEVAAGVNLSLQPAGFQPLLLTFAGGLEVCGTAGNPVEFLAPFRGFIPYAVAAACVTVVGNGQPSQLDVSNCRFVNITIRLDQAAGEFQNCTFRNCRVYVQESPVTFQSCTFLTSTLTVMNFDAANGTNVLNSSFNGTRVLDEMNSGEPRLDGDGLAVYGHARIEGCEISGYDSGISSQMGLPVVSGCHVFNCDAGIALLTEDQADTPLLENCTVEECAYAGAFASGNLLLRNCTFRNNSAYGLVLSSYYGYRTEGLASNWTTSGNRIYGNGEYGLLLYGQEHEAGDTRFDDGAGTFNLKGRILMMVSFVLNVSAPDGGAIDYYRLDITNALGVVTTQNVTRERVHYMEFIDYFVDNSGTRHDLAPYTLLVSAKGVSGELSVGRGMWNATLQLPVLPDLMPAGADIDPPSPVGDQYVSFALRVRNAGPTVSRRVKVDFYIDGEKLDEVDLFELSPNSTYTVRALDWKARPGHHVLTAQIDPSGSLAENNRTNNNFTLDFTVGPAPAAPAKGQDWCLPGLAVAALGAGVLGYALFRRRRAGGEP